MHIAEGVVTGVPAAVSIALGVGLVGIGARKMKAFAQEHPDQKPLLGMAGAFIFFLSLIPLPAFTGTCSHPCGSPLAGILLGPAIGIALSGLSLLLQAAFFSHGGFSTWGVNLISLGVGGAFFGWLTFAVARRLGAPLWLAGGLGGLVGDVVTYLISGAVLAGALVSGPHPRYTFNGYLAVIYLAYLPTQGPIAIGEMILTALSLNYINQQRPEILQKLRVIPAPAVAATLTILLALLVSHPALAQQPGVAPPGAIVVNASQGGVKGMDEAVNDRLAAEAGRPVRPPYLNTEKLGDAWYCILLFGGAVPGFVMGRWYHLIADSPSIPASSDEVAHVQNA